MFLIGSARGLTSDFRENIQGAGHGPGFIPGRSGPNVGSCISALSSDTLGAERAGLAPVNSHKRPISSAPQQLPFHGKKNKLPPDSDQRYDPDQDDTNRILRGRID